MRRIEIISAIAADLVNQFDPKFCSFLPGGDVPFMLGGGGPSYTIPYACRFNDDDAAYLYRTGWPANGDQQKGTLSVWVKRCNFGTSQAIFAESTGTGDIAWLRFNASDQLEVIANGGGSYITSNAKYRDPTAWMHVVMAIDTTQATAANRCRLYVNGVEITSFAAATYWAQNALLKMNHTSYAPRISYSATHTIDMYLAEHHWIEGQQLTPSSFGQTDSSAGTWVPKQYTGTYGTNGFYLDFADSAVLGNDVSGNNNDFTSSGLASNDRVTDTPTNNYATWLGVNEALNATLSDGHLQLACSAAERLNGIASICLNDISGGKVYWESKFTTTSAIYAGFGVANEAASRSQFVGNNVNSWGWRGDGNKYTSGTGTAFGTALTQNDVVMVAVDVSAGKIWVGKNGTWFNSGNPAAGTGEMFSGLAGKLFAVGSNMGGAGSHTQIANFGQQGFTYTPPSGFKALCSDSISTPTIARGNKYADIGLYTGNGTSVSLTGLGFQPDVVIGRTRGSVTNAFAYDSGRGTTKRLDPVDNTAEATVAQGLTAFNADGFTMGSDADHNTNAATYWAMLLKKGAVPGVDVVTYTGDNTANRNISHNLGASPKMALIKRRDSAGSWYLWHAGYSGAAYFTTLEGTCEVESSTNSPFGTGNWSSTQFMVTNNATNNLNASGATYVAILFAEVSGFSRFVAFDGNGAADGPFVWCGFKPASVMGWPFAGSVSFYAECLDARRNIANPRTSHIWPGNTSAENLNGDGFYTNIDFLAAGLKFRKAGGTMNTSGNKTALMVFAENPFKYARAA